MVILLELRMCTGMKIAICDDYITIAAELKTSIEAICAQKDWALECARSCRVVYDWAKPGDDIDEGFLREHGALPVDQALRGAYRLARVLNGLFDN